MSYSNWKTNDMAGLVIKFPRLALGYFACICLVQFILPMTPPDIF